MSFPALVWAMKQPVGNAYEKAVLWVLADFANDRYKHTAWPSVATIARLCGMGDKGVRAAIHRLAKRGLIEISGSTIRRRYRIALSTPAPDAEGPVPDTEAVSAAPVSHTGASGVRHRDSGAPHRQSY